VANARTVVSQRRRLINALTLIACAMLATGTATDATPAPTVYASDVSSGPLAAAAQRIGVAPRVPNGATYLGAMAGSSALQADVALEPQDPAALAQVAAQVSTPGSPLYRHYLAVGAFASEFGPSATATSTVEAQLSAKGLQVGQVTPHSEVILGPAVSSRTTGLEGARTSQTRCRYGWPPGRGGQRRGLRARAEPYE
jgi:hypothetical protein